MSENIDNDFSKVLRRQATARRNKIEEASRENLEEIAKQKIFIKQAQERLAELEAKRILLQSEFDAHDAIIKEPEAYLKGWNE